MDAGQQSSLAYTCTSSIAEPEYSRTRTQGATYSCVRALRRAQVQLDHFGGRNRTRKQLARYRDGRSHRVGHFTVQLRHGIVDGCERLNSSRIRCRIVGSGKKSFTPRALCSSVGTGAREPTQEKRPFLILRCSQMIP